MVRDDQCIRGFHASKVTVLGHQWTQNRHQIQRRRILDHNDFGQQLLAVDRRTFFKAAAGLLHIILLNDQSDIARRNSSEAMDLQHG